MTTTDAMCVTLADRIAQAREHARSDGFELIHEGTYVRWREITTGEVWPGRYPSYLDALDILCPTASDIVRGLAG